MATPVNNKLLNAAILHIIALHRYSNNVVRQIQAVLRSADADLYAQLNVALSRAAETSFSVRRLDELLVSVSALNDRVYAEAKLKLNAEMVNLTEYESNYQRQLFERVLPSGVRVTSPSVTQAYAAATASPFKGHLLSEWFDELPRNKQRRMIATVRMGFLEGKTVSEIMKEVRGTAAEGFKDGIVNLDRRAAESVVRTAVSNVAATAREEFYALNSDLIEAEQWFSTLDNRTTEECQIRDGLKYTLIDHQPIGHSVPWLGGPGKIHWCCRSTSLPIIRSSMDLGLNLPPVERAAMGGTAAPKTTYEDWIQQQSATMQDDILGPTRGKLMREGKMPWDTFFSATGVFLTLDELRQRDPESFKAAGL